MKTIRNFDLVIALYIFGVVTAELMSSKTFPLFNFSWLHINAPVAIFLLPLLFTLTDVVVEVKGKARARSMVLSGLVVIGLLIIFSFISTSLPPSNRFVNTESAYDAIFKSSIQISIASLIAFASSEHLAVKLRIM